MDFEVDPPAAYSEATGQVLDLDKLVGSPGAEQGLAHHAAYQIHVWARKGASGSYVYSNPSDAIIIIDTPITVATGHSPGAEANRGKAQLTWTRVHTGEVLGDSSFPDGDYYYFRYRRASTGHDTVGWSPGKYITDQTTKASDLQNGDTITKLKTGEVYAVQLRYVKSGKPSVFAVRDAYVWVSDRQAGGGTNAGERVASFPLTQRLTNKTYSYRICEETFFPHDEANPDNSRRNHWEKLIEHAGSQWQRATQGLITVIREVDIVTDANGNKKTVNKPCAGYQDIVNRIRTRINTEMLDANLLMNLPLTDDDIRGHILDLVRGLHRDNVISRLQTADAMHSEIFMWDDLDAPLGIAYRVGAFRQISDDIGYEEGCWWTPAGDIELANMCSVGGDIIIRRSAYDSRNTTPGARDPITNNLLPVFPSADDPLKVPEDTARFNICLNDSDHRLNTAYDTILHEFGHPLGIAGHPTLYGNDSVMNYNFEEPDCSPHPLDIMAIYALYARP